MAQCFNCGKTDPPAETFYYYNECTEESGWLCKECYERYKIKDYLRSSEIFGFELPQFVKDSLEKQLPIQPLIWKGKPTPESPVPNDDWGYACPMCGSKDVDYPDHHCTCGQRLDWSEF